MDITIRGITYSGYNHLMRENRPTCFIEYSDNFIIHTRHPLYGFMDEFWYYPCFFNNKKVELIPADLEKLGYHNYGIWGTHYK